jgi:hypothetical protein
MGCKTKQCDCIQKDCGEECGCCNCENPISRNPTLEMINTQLNMLSALHTYTLKQLKYICKQNKISTARNSKEVVMKLLRTAIAARFDSDTEEEDGNGDEDENQVWYNEEASNTEEEEEEEEND